MQKFKEKFMRFMAGRYGTDKLNNALLVLYIIIYVVGLFFHSIVLQSITWIVLLIMFYRIFSKDIYRRSRENIKFLEIWGAVTKKVLYLRNRFKDRRTHVYHTCPHCKVSLRLPRKKGDHSVVCPKCGGRFDMKVR